MALSRVTTWVSGQVLTAAALNSEFNNILTNPISLISPTTGNINFGNNRALSFNLENLSADPAVASSGRIYWNTAKSQVGIDDGTIIRVLPTVSATAALPGSLISVTSSGPGLFTILPLGTSGQVLTVTSSGLGAAFANFSGSVASTTVTGQIGSSQGGTGANLSTGAGVPTVTAAGAWSLQAATRGGYTFWSSTNTISGSTAAFNVLAWGSNAAAFNSAIQALPTSGGTIYAPGGSYALGGTQITLDRPVTILGDGRASTKMTSTGDITFKATSTTAVGSVAFKNFALSLTSTGTGIVVNLGTEARDCEFDSLSISGGTRALDIQNNAIYCSITRNYLSASSQVLTITNTFSEDRGDNMVLGNNIEGTSTQTTGIRLGVAGSRINGNKVYAVNKCMYITAGEFEIANNAFANNGSTTGGPVLDLLAPSTGGGRDFTIANNFIGGNGGNSSGTGIAFDTSGAGTWAAGAIVGNSFRDTSRACIYLDGTCTWINIVGNQAQGNIGIVVTSEPNTISAGGNFFQSTAPPYALTAGGGLRVQSNEVIPLANLAALDGGSHMWCSDCDLTGNMATCTSSGNGSYATRIAGAWKCQ